MRRVTEVEFYLRYGAPRPMKKGTIVSAMTWHSNRRRLDLPNRLPLLGRKRAWTSKYSAILSGTTVHGLALHRMRNQSAAMTKRLPHGDQAILDKRKIEDYCLNPSHPRGRHKARVFREALDLQRSDASWLRDALLEAARSAEAFQDGEDAWGTH
jgi:uncharacterized protein DUF6883